MKVETYARTAALFLTAVLLLGLYARHNPTATVGHWVYLPQCEEDNAIVVNSRAVVHFLLADGSLKINQDDIDKQALPGVLAQIYETRADNTLYLRASPLISYQELMEVVAKVQDRMHDFYSLPRTASMRLRSAIAIADSRAPLTSCHLSLPFSNSRRTTSSSTFSPPRVTDSHLMSCPCN